MSKSLEETVADLEAKANVSNEKLSDTLQQLVYQVQPQTKLDQLKAEAKYKAEEARYAAVTTIDQAREGDRGAQIRLLKAVGIGVAAIGLLVLKGKLKRRHRR